MIVDSEEFAELVEKVKLSIFAAFTETILGGVDNAVKAKFVDNFAKFTVFLGLLAGKTLGTAIGGAGRILNWNDEQAAGAHGEAMRVYMEAFNDGLELSNSKLRVSAISSTDMRSDN